MNYTYAPAQIMTLDLETYHKATQKNLFVIDTGFSITARVHFKAQFKQEGENILVSEGFGWDRVPIPQSRKGCTLIDAEVYHRTGKWPAVQCQISSAPQPHVPQMV